MWQNKVCPKICEHTTNEINPNSRLQLKCCPSSCQIMWGKPSQKKNILAPVLIDFDTFVKVKSCPNWIWHFSNVKMLPKLCEGSLIWSRGSSWFQYDPMWSAIEVRGGRVANTCHFGSNIIKLRKRRLIWQEASLRIKNIALMYSSLRQIILSTCFKPFICPFQRCPVFN